VVAANVVLFMYYTSPLSTLADVLRHRDSSSLTLPMSVMNVVNGLLWLVYGLVRSDAFIWLPNGVGACLGAVQVFLCCIFPRRQTQASAMSGCAPRSALSIHAACSAPVTLFSCSLNVCPSCSHFSMKHK
jgi:uncharacterized protein with PQ loop repeat